MNASRARSRAVSALAVIVLMLIAAPSDGRSKREPTPVPSPSADRTGASPAFISRDGGKSPWLVRRASTANDTIILGSWDFEGCDAQGWTSADRTAQEGTYFHVDDFAGLGGGDFGRLYPLEGTQSMWCGARPSPSEPLCSYATLPGYGNRWSQYFQTAACLTVTGDVTIDYLIAWDVEPDFDYVELEYDTCDDDWVTLEGGRYVWEGIENGFRSSTVDSSLHSGSLRLRFHFASDGEYSDADGLYDSDGAVILDSLTVRDDTGIVLATELFEAEAAGATTTLSGNWMADAGPVYGDYAALFPGTALLQEDPCRSNLSCMWAFIAGSTVNYACGGHPEQISVPFETAQGQYIHNQIWSPWIPLTGTGNTFELAFDVYEDLDLDYLIFYEWSVRSRPSGSCPAPWRDRGYVYWGEKEWDRVVDPIDDLIDPGAEEIQVALTVRDMYPYWGASWTPYCHSHAPLFDNVEVRRVDTVGPQWEVNPAHLFQDNFSTDGTITGTVRADAAIDIKGKFTYGDILPGDSVTVTVTHPDGRVAADIYTGVGPALYTYVSVRPSGQSGKHGTALTADPSRWPVRDTVLVDGEKWYSIRMDSVRTSSGASETTFCIDLNDNLFTPGDTILYVFGGFGDLPAMEVSYYSYFTGTTDDAQAAFANPMEFTCLPTQSEYFDVEYDAIRPILYVDFYDGLGAQPYFDAAFAELGITPAVDRYDVLAPAAREGNSPGGRVVDAAVQLGNYGMIVWSTGDLDYRDGILGDGVNFKYDDTGMLADYLNNGGRVYFTGDDIAGALPSALRNNYIAYSVTNDSHVDAGFGIAPQVFGVDGGIFDHGSEDWWTVYGGCPSLNEFDVLAPGDPSSSQATYSLGASAVIYSNQVVLSGFSFHTIRDVMHDFQPSTPAHHLWDIIRALNWIIIDDVEAAPYVNALAQNVPNPFNPTTAIEFSVKERAPVTLRVYNVRGQRVKTLVDDTRAPGVIHRIEWDGRNDAGQRVASGVYFYRLVTRGFVKTRKMVLLK
jgi:hypothetical protein